MREAEVCWQNGCQELWREDMKIRARVLSAVLAGTCMLGGFAPSAHTRFGIFKTNQPHPPKKLKKNTSPYAYLGPTKHKKAKGWYQSTLTGKTVYGTPPKK
jgi:hypothetical protein